jgi:hypothetical protein
MNRSQHIHAAASGAPDNLIRNPLDKVKRDEERLSDKPKPRDPKDKLITNPLEKPGAGDKLIRNPLDKR